MTKRTQPTRTTNPEQTQQRNPPLIDVLVNQRNDALNALAMVQAELIETKQLLDAYRERVTESPEELAEDLT